MHIGMSHSAAAQGHDPTTASPAMITFGLCDDFDLIAEANHRIANHLALLAASVRLRIGDVSSSAAEPTRDSVRVLLQGFGGQIGAILRLHRALATSARLESVALFAILANEVGTARRCNTPPASGEAQLMGGDRRFMSSTATRRPAGPLTVGPISAPG